ncbi:MAG: bifunctional phosphopantothenoylcysteine decarboxylase/phosphopantothenate--cysteine ligase CoaBC [Gammaproteobacteria bacterium]
MISKRILLAICGGIAAYKSAELIRLLRKQGAEIRVVMTGAAQQFMTPLTLQALSGHPVHTQLLDAEQENAMSHINLARWADLLLVAPASADSIAKFSYGLADELLSTLYLAATCPIYVAPAMNQAMWHKSVTQQNIQRLQQQGTVILGPAQGEQACGESGFGRMLEPQEICRLLFPIPMDASRLFRGKKILISAGPTREALDPVRYISNRSSGKMGYALAIAALEAGAEVILVSGPTALPKPEKVMFVPVESALQMYDQVMYYAGKCDVYIGAAAVADYRPAKINAQKIKKQGDEICIALEKNPDILASVAALPQGPFTVGFAAETQDLEHYARNKLHTKNLDMIAANLVGQASGGFDSDVNALQVFWPDGQQFLPETSKQRLAAQLIALIGKKLHEKNTTQIIRQPARQ